MSQVRKAGSDPKIRGDQPAAYYNGAALPIRWAENGHVIQDVLSGPWVEH